MEIIIAVGKATSQRMQADSWRCLMIVFADATKQPTRNVSERKLTVSFFYLQKQMVPQMTKCMGGELRYWNYDWIGPQLKVEVN